MVGSYVVLTRCATDRGDSGLCCVVLLLCGVGSHSASELLLCLGFWLWLADSKSKFNMKPLPASAPGKGEFHVRTGPLDAPPSTLTPELAASGLSPMRLLPVLVCLNGPRVHCARRLCSDLTCAALLVSTLWAVSHPFGLSCS